MAYGLMAAFGAIFAFLTVVRLRGGVLIDQGFSGYDLWIVLCGALGSAAALRMSGDKMGQTGGKGVVSAIYGGNWISFVGALIAGTLALPLYGTMFGPFVLGVTLYGAPLLAGLWAANLIAVHMLLISWNRERNSIFHARLPADAVALR